MSLRLAASASGTKNTFDQTVNFVSTYGGVSGGSKATNDTALSSFNTAYAAFTGRTQLVIPPGGDFDFTSAVWGSLGGDKLTITATGATLRNQAGFANSGLADDITGHANIATVSAGVSTVSLITGAQTSRFTVDQWVIVAGIDWQGYGYPINPGIFEFKKIASIGTGTLTFTEPLVNAYKSTWPNYNPGEAGLHIYGGGPATVYGLLAPWNQEVELVGAYVRDSSLFYGKVREAKYTDCTFEDYGPCPTVNVLYRALRCTCLGSGGIEVDKLVHRMEVIDCSFAALAFQSSSVNQTYVRNTTASQYWRGTSGTSTIIGLNTPEFRFGPTSYGVTTGLTTVTNCNSANATWSNNYDTLLSAYTEAGGGILTYTDVDIPPAWAVPGGWYVLTDATDAFNAISFQVTDITRSGGVTSITTTLPYPVPATSGGKSAPWQIHSHPGAYVTATNCTGSTLFTDQSALPANSPLFGWTL